MAELKKTVDDVVAGVGTAAKWGAFLILLRQIGGELGQCVRTVSLLSQIYWHGGRNITEDTLKLIRDNRRGILYLLLVIVGGAAFFFSLGASYTSPLLMTIGGFFLIIPLIVVATAGQAVAYLIALYIRVGTGALSAAYKILLQVAESIGADTSAFDKDPINFTGENLRGGIAKLWGAIIPIGLVTTFCIFFPSWRAIYMMPITIFLLIIMGIMVNQWADIDLVADDKKLIRTARAKRRLYGLVSFMMTVWLIWTAFAVVANNTAGTLKGLADKGLLPRWIESRIAARETRENRKSIIRETDAGMTLAVFQHWSVGYTLKNGVFVPDSVAKFADGDTVSVDDHKKSPVRSGGEMMYEVVLPNNVGDFLGTNVWVPARKLIYVSPVKSCEKSATATPKISTITRSGYTVEVKEPNLMPEWNKRLVWMKSDSLIDERFEIHFDSSIGSFPAGTKSNYYNICFSSTSYYITSDSGLFFTAKVNKLPSGDLEVFVM